MLPVVRECVVNLLFSCLNDPPHPGPNGPNYVSLKVQRALLPFKTFSKVHLQTRKFHRLGHLAGAGSIREPNCRIGRIQPRVSPSS